MRLLVCFPHAGAGASFFRPWTTALQDVFEILPVQLPGREERFAEPCHTNIDDAVTGVLPSIASKARDRSCVVIFGHCLGALLAYELAGRLSTEYGVVANHLVVSGAHAPTHRCNPPTKGLTDEEFLEELRRRAAYVDPALEDSSLQDLLLPLLRADIEMHESYAPRRIQTLNLPITSIRGRSDQFVQAEHTARWQEVTQRRLEQLEMEGGHMYLAERPVALFDVLDDIATAGA